MSGCRRRDNQEEGKNRKRNSRYNTDIYKTLFIATHYVNVISTCLDLRSEANHLEEQLQVTIDRDGLVESRLCLFMLQEQLNSRIAGLREQLKERKNEITKLLMEQQTLCEDMQCDGKELSLEPLASATELSDFRRHLSELVTEKCERIVQIRDYQQKIKKMCNRLETPLTIRSEIE